jgi:hypothetical protein
VQGHLGGHSRQRLHQEVSGAYPGLDRAERVLDRLAPLATGGPPLACFVALLSMQMRVAPEGSGLGGQHSLDRSGQTRHSPDPDRQRLRRSRPRPAVLTCRCRPRNHCTSINRAGAPCCAAGGRRGFASGRAAQYLRMNVLIWLKARGQWERLDRFSRGSNLPVLRRPRPAVSRGDAERRAFLSPNDSAAARCVKPQHPLGLHRAAERPGPPGRIPCFDRSSMEPA